MPSNSFRLAFAAGLATSVAASAQSIIPAEDLTDGAFRQGFTSGTDSLSNASNWSFFTFTAVQGDHITIEVNRLAGGLDPASSVVRGDASGIPFSSLTGSGFDTWSGPSLSPVLAHGDDEDPPAIPGPFGDPRYSFTAPATSQYTVMVCGIDSSSLTTVYPFEISVRGSSWGGACCLGDGTCIQIGSAALCTGMNGVYRGDSATCSGAHCACNILINGGFESGDLSGWTQFGSTDHTGVDKFYANSGRFGAFLGAVDTPGGIQQIIPVPAGTPLVLDFWYHSDGTPQSFSADIGGINLISLVDDESRPTPTEFTFPIIAPVNNPVLRLSARNDPSYVVLDDIRVCAGDGSPITCYANCDSSTVNPILNVNDFQCFLNKFAQGCS